MTERFVLTKWRWEGDGCLEPTKIAESAFSYEEMLKVNQRMEWIESVVITFTNGEWEVCERR